jgi:hypothetical protein
MPTAPERPRSYLLVVAAAAILVLAVPLYFLFRDPVEPSPAEAVPQPVVRDSAIVAPPLVDTAAQQQTAAAAPTGEFPERRLPPEVPTVGAGAATVTEQRASDESFVIDGALLEEIEEGADEAAPAESTTN